MALVKARLNSHMASKRIGKRFGTSFAGFSWSRYWAAHSPDNLVVTDITGGRRVTWEDNSSVEEGFEIWVSEDEGAFTLLDTVAANVITYDDLVSRTGYVFYKVRAVAPYENYSEFSDEAEAYAVDSDMQVILDRMDTQPNQETLEVYQRNFLKLKDEGLLAKLDLLWILFAHDGQASYINWAQNAFDLWLYSGTPVHTPKEGWYAAVRSVLRSDYIPATHAVNLQLNSGLLAFRISNDFAEASGAELGVNNESLDGVTRTGYLSSQCYYPGEKCHIAVNSDNWTQSYSNLNSKGRYLENRTASNIINKYKDGVLKLAATTPTKSLPENYFCVLSASRAPSGVFETWGHSDLGISYVAVGGGFTDTEALRVDEILNDFYNEMQLVSL